LLFGITAEIAVNYRSSLSGLFSVGVTDA